MRATGPSPGPPPPPQMATTQTQTQTQTQVQTQNQTQAQNQTQTQQVQHQPKSDAGNQTIRNLPTEPAKLIIPGKPAETPAIKTAPSPQQALVAPSAKLVESTASVISTQTPAAVATTEAPPSKVEAPPTHQLEGGVLKPQQPIGQQVKDKQPPQKAIVKPQVLTHIIDGLVIQEGPEPFPVSPFNKCIPLRR